MNEDQEISPRTGGRSPPSVHTRTYLKYAIGALFAGPIAYLLGIFFILPEQILRSLGPLASMLIGGVAWVFFIKGRIQATIKVLTYGTWMLMTGILIFHGGVRGTAVVVYPLVILMVGWLIGARAAVLIALLTLATTLGFVLADAHGLLPPQPPTPPTLYWIVQSAVTVFSAILVIFLVRSYRARLVEVRKLGDELASRNTELLATRSRLTATLDAIPDLMFDVDLEGRYHDYFAPKIDNLSTPPESRVGTNLQDVLPAAAAEVCMLALHEAHEKGRSQGLQYELPLPQGLFWFELSVSRKSIVPGEGPRFIVLSRDITERKRIDAARQKALDLLQKIAGRVPGVVYQYRMRPDGSSCFPYASEAIRQIYRVSPDEVAQDASSVFAVLHPDDYEAVARSIEASRRSLNPWEQEYRVKFSDDVIRWLHGNAVPEREEDGSTLWHGFITDITTRKAYAQERQSLESQLRESQKMEAIGTLAGGIAHDFNNILGTILGNAELARQDSGRNPLTLQSLDEISKAGQRARDLIRQILSFSRRQPTSNRVLSLRPHVEEVLGLLRSTLLARVAIECIYGDNVPNIYADSVQVEQVLLNLITNAAQALDGKPGRIDIDVAGVDITEAGAFPGASVVPGRYARLSVRDSGQGMDEATLKRAFEPFFTTKPVGTGSGLGLSVVYGIMQAHGGAVSVESWPGHGSLFVLLFPGAGTAASICEPALPILRKQDAVTQGQRILYIDDDESLVVMVTRLLARRGHVLTGYMDQHEALLAFQANPVAFDLVITDYNLPGMNGIEVAQEIRNIRPDLPIAIASGFITDELRSQAEAMGIHDIIFKPNAVEEYCDAVDNLTTGRL